MGPTPGDYLDLIGEIRSLVKLHHAVVLRNWSAEHGLQPGAGELLVEVAKRGESRVSDLADERLVDPSVISRQVAQLERLGLVARRRAAEDGRVALLRVTPEGERVLQRLRNQQVDLVGDALAGWRAEELRQAAGSLRRLNADIRAALVASPTRRAGDLAGSA